MFNLSLTACSFYFQKLHARGVSNIFYLNKDLDYWDKASRKTGIISLQDLFKNFFRAYENSKDDADKQTTFYCEFNDSFSGEFEDFYFLYTVINSGTYGSASEIRDKDTNELVHRKTPKQADVKPFYLYIVIPKDSDSVNVQKGMLFFQNTGQFGVKTITTDYMIKFFADKYNLAFKWRTVSSELFLKKIITKKNINKLILIKNHVSDDKADSTGIGYGVETRIVSKLFRVDNAWDEFMEGVRFFMNGKHNLFEFEGEDFNALKINVLIGGKERTIDMHNLENLSIVEGIPNEIRKQDGFAG